LTADGEWFIAGALEPRFHAELVRLRGLPEWADARWGAVGLLSGGAVTRPDQPRG